MRDLEEKCFLFLLAAISLAFVWILWPLSGAILWGTVLAIVFAPLYRWVLRSLRNDSAASVATVGIVTLIVILPLLVVGSLVVAEAVGLYQKIEAREIDLAQLLRRLFEALPSWATGALDHFGLTTVAGIQERLAAALAQASQFIAAQALSIGQNTFELVASFFLVLYLLFFLLRDGNALTVRVRRAIPLDPEQRRALFGRFAEVTRATVKGTVVVAAIQGALGGLIFWFLGIPAALLWGAVMAMAALLPAIGAALIWVPVSVYLLATGSVWEGIVLSVFGVVVIGLADNVLRPVLVGKETRLPDYLVLFSTLGGIAIFGINGLVIGPIVAALFVSAWDLFAASRARTADDRPDASG